MKRNFKVRLLCISIAIASNPALSGDFKAKVSKSVPKGFENIVSSNMFYDVFINSNYLGTLEAVTKQGKNTLVSPGKILNEIDNNIPLGEMLSSEFPLDSSSIVDGDNYYLTFNPKINTIIIYTKKLTKQIKSTSGNHWKSNIDGYFSGIDDDIIEKSLNLDSSFSHNDHLVKFTGFIDSKNNSEITGLYHSNLIGKDRLNTGVQASKSFGKGRFMGVSYYPNAKNLESNLSRAPIALLLKGPGTVLIKKNNQVIHVSNETEQNLVIPTLNLPDGSYYVDIEINYSDGNTESIRKYISSSYKKSDNTGIENISIGVKTESDDYFNAHSYNDIGVYFSSSYSFPTTKMGSFNTGLNYYKDLSIFASHHASMKNIEFATRARVGTNNSWSINNETSHQQGNHHLSIGGRLSHQENNYSDPVNLSSANVRYSYRHLSFGTFDFGLSASRNNTIYRATHSYDLISDRSHRLTIRTNISRDTELSTGIELSYQLSPTNSQFSYLGTAGLDSEESQYRHDLRHSYKGINQNINSSAIASSSGDYSNKSIQTHLTDTRFGQMQGQIGTSKTNKTSKKYYNGSFKTGVAGSRNEIILSGNKNINQGVIINLTDFPVDNYILIIDDKRYKIAGGSRRSINLYPHRKYKISLINENNPYIKVRNRKKEVYIDLNSTQILSWEIDKVTLFSGKALLDNQPMKDKKVISSVDTSYTDNNGYFTIETINNEQKISIGDTICDISSVGENLNFSNISCLRQQTPKE